MKLTNDDVQVFAQAQLNTFKLNTFKINENAALREISDELTSEYRDLNSAEVMKSRYKFFKISDTKSIDYSERLLDLGGGKKVIYGIRHLGANRKMPFIQLKTNFKIKNKNEALEIYHNLKDEFLVFKPLYLCFWSNEKDIADKIGATYLVTTARKIKGLRAWSNEEELELRIVLDDSYYEAYEYGYKCLYKERPDLENKVTLNSLNVMKESRMQGLLYEAFISNDKIGLISAQRSSFLGSESIYFNEIFIDKKWRTRGYSKALQRKFIEKCAFDDDYIWGTIDYSNIPSYKTALSNERSPIRYECFIKLKGEF